MKRQVTVAAGIAAGVTAIALIVTPAIANVGGGATPGTPTTCSECTGTRQGGAGPSAQSGTAMGDRRGNGMSRDAVGGSTAQRGMGSMEQNEAPSGTLTTDQKAALASMAEEEKLAHDLYVALAARFPSDVEFAQISTSETRHLTSVRNLLATYDIPDPTLGLAPGVFASARFQSLYDSLLASATTSEKALAAGVTVEKADIADLTSAMQGITAPDVTRVYSHLLSGSQRHLVAFGG